MRRKRRHVDPEKLDRWLVSYADFITLLFAFFVVMYSISSVNDGKYRVLSSTLIDAFKQSPRSPEPIQIGERTHSLFQAWPDPSVGLPGATPSGAKPASGSRPTLLPEPPVMPWGDIVRHEMANPAEQGGEVDLEPQPEEQEALEPEEEEFPLNPIATDIKAAMAPFIDRRLVEVNQKKYWVEVEIKSKMLFASGSARMSRGALRVLGKVSDILKPLSNTINVEGHTDNVPIMTATFPSNWELSAARAASVVHLFTRLGIAPKRLVAIGYGEYRPVADNNVEAGRQKNRRVSLLIMAKRSQPEGRDFPVPPKGGGL